MNTILIVDDVKTDRELLGRIVASAGYRVVYAADGAQAITAAKAEKPVLILLDVVMPNMDGFAACRALKKDPDTAGIPVVVVTSKVADSDKFWAKKQGADDHVAKPFSSEAIEAVIHRLAR